MFCFGANFWGVTIPTTVVCPISFFYSHPGENIPELCILTPLSENIDSVGKLHCMRRGRVGRFRPNPVSAWEVSAERFRPSLRAECSWVRGLWWVGRGEVW
jgi:hypothetical protein